MVPSLGNRFPRTTSCTANEYHDGLWQHYNARLASLRDRLRRSTTDADREQIRSEIEATEKEFTEKVKEIDKLIF